MHKYKNNLCPQERNKLLTELLKQKIFRVNFDLKYSQIHDLVKNNKSFSKSVY